jgi:L-threonylcarbamoyladenylate synthase
MEKIDINIDKKELKELILLGKIFIYPTDTIYGIGCDATNIKSVNMIKELKKRNKDKPMSVIAPDIHWIKDNLIIDVNLDEYLPGPYTIILKKKNKDFLSHVSNTDSLGIRIPDNKFTKKIQESKVPFITTSVNISGKPNIKNISEIKKSMFKKVDYVIDLGELSGNPSTFVINGREIQR